MKITYMGSPVHEQTPRNNKGQFSFKSVKARSMKFLKKFVIPVLSLIGLAYGMAITGFFMAPEKAISVETKVMVPDNSIPPILEKIAQCESNNSHYDKNGQVLINRTQDVGKYQIHVPIWGKKAHEMGLNLAVEKDNEAMALWLYKNHGTEPWVHSKKCWVR